MYVSYMGELTVWIVFPTVAICMYKSSPLVPLDSCLTAVARVSSACACLLVHLPLTWYSILPSDTSHVPQHPPVCCPDHLHEGGGSTKVKNALCSTTCATQYWVWAHTSSTASAWESVSLLVLLPIPADSETITFVFSSPLFSIPLLHLTNISFASSLVWLSPVNTRSTPKKKKNSQSVSFSFF